MSSKTINQIVKTPEKACKNHLVFVNAVHGDKELSSQLQTVLPPLTNESAKLNSCDCTAVVQTKQTFKTSPISYKASHICYYWPDAKFKLLI